jgi:hypothetical protein
MASSAKARFCSFCEKEFIDLIKKTAFAAGNYFKENQAKRLCDHIYTLQLNLIIVKLSLGALQKHKFTPWLFAIAL